MSSITQLKDVNDLKPQALLTNLGINVGLSLITLGAFCVLRPKNGVIYAKKYKSSPQEKRAPKLDEGYFSWMGPVWSCPDEELVDKIGLDAVVFIRFLRMCRTIFLAMAILGCCALIPVNIVATLRGLKPNETADKIGMLSISGITDPTWLWASVAGVWVFSLIMYIAVFFNYKTFVQFKIRFYQSEAYQEEVASRTIMLAGLPSSLQTDEKLLKFMMDMGLNEKPVQALVGRKVDKLPELMEKHKTMVKALEKVVAKHYADPNRVPEKRPTVRVGGICGAKVDAIDHYSQQIEELNDQIDHMRNQVSKSQPTNYGFVSYGTIHAAHRVAKELSSVITLRTRSKMIDPPEVFLSPVPKDIIWFNVSNPKQLRHTRKILVNVAFGIASLLFFIPMGFLMTFAGMDRFTGFFPQTKNYFETHKFAASLVSSLLPVLLLDILLLIVKKIIVFLAWFQGNITKSSTDRSTLAKFFFFFTLNNLIVPAIVGTLLSFVGQIKTILNSFSFSKETWLALTAILNGKTSIIDMISQNAIDTSIFWVNYISLRNFSALLDLFQIVSLVLYWAKTTLTPRESKAMNKPDVFDFPLFFSAHIFLLTVALLYSVVAPLVLFFACVYFSLASLVYKYQLMYVFRTKVETGGRLFRVVFNRVLVALVLFQIVMVGILNLKKVHTHSLAILPLPFLTILFKIFLMKSYDPKIDYYDYGSAHEERHLFKNKTKGNALLLNFENPVLKTKIVTALVPDAAKKAISKKILIGDGDDNEGKTKGGRQALKKQSSRGRFNSDEQMEEMESYEMGHVSKSPKLKKEKYDNSDYDQRTTSPNRQQRYDYPTQQSHYVLEADDPVDNYYDDQKESLTKSATQRYDDTYSNRYSPPKKEYGAQDMTSFVAGRYKADRSADPYSYSSSNNNNKGSGGANGTTNYLELAKMHQTENYKNTGKATQYEDKRALHMPPVNFHIPKGGQSSSRNQQTNRSDNGYNNEDYGNYNDEPVSPKPSSRFPQSQRPSGRKTQKDSPNLHHSSSSPSLNTEDADLSYNNPNVKSMARAFTQGVQKPKNTYNDGIVSSTRGRNNDYV